VEWKKLGLRDLEIMNRIPGLSSADLEAAWEYYGKYREEIEQTIRENVEA
jgi:uncharacterized protein (DUF433 family)